MCFFHCLSGLTLLIWESVWDREKVNMEGVDSLQPSLVS